MVYICPIGSREGMTNFFFWKSVFVKHPSVQCRIYTVDLKIDLMAVPCAGFSTVQLYIQSLTHCQVRPDGCMLYGWLQPWCYVAVIVVLLFCCYWKGTPGWSIEMLCSRVLHSSLALIADWPGVFVIVIVLVIVVFLVMVLCSKHTVHSNAE